MAQALSIARMNFTLSYRVSKIQHLTFARSVLLRSKILMLLSKRSSGAGKRVEPLDPMCPHGLMVCRMLACEPKQILSCVCGAPIFEIQFLSRGTVNVTGGGTNCGATIFEEDRCAMCIMKPSTLVVQRCNTCSRSEQVISRTTLQYVAVSRSPIVCACDDVVHDTRYHPPRSISKIGWS